MIYKVHWIVDGIAEIEVTQKRMQKKNCKKVWKIMSKNQTFDGQVAKSIQGTAYLPGNEENDKKDDNKEKLV